MTEIVKSLTAVELSTLDKYEAVINSGLKTFADVGNALLAIRDARLYREQHATFEAYCKDRWGLKQTRAYQLMDAAKVTKQLQSSTIVELPRTESQARPLARLPAEEQPEAWEAASNKAKEEDRPVTARDVEAEVQERVQRGEESARPRIKHVAPCDGMQFARLAITDLKQIKHNDTERHQAFATVKEWINENE